MTLRGIPIGQKTPKPCLNPLVMMPGWPPILNICLLKTLTLQGEHITIAVTGIVDMMII